MEIPTVRHATTIIAITTDVIGVVAVAAANAVAMAVATSMAIQKPYKLG